LVISLNEVLAELDHGLGIHALGSQELVGRLADALRHHHELAERRDLARVAVALELQGQDRLRGLEQIDRLAVDRAQRLADLGQRLLLGDHDARALLGAIDERHSAVDRILHAGWRSRNAAFAGLQAAHVVGEHYRAVLDFGERRRVAGQRLRHRLGEPLRLHQRLAACRDLRRAAPGRDEREDRERDQADQAKREHHEQDALLLGGRAVADQRQRRAERRGARIGVLQAGLGEVGESRRHGLRDDRRRLRLAFAGLRHRVERGSGLRVAERQVGRRMRDAATGAIVVGHCNVAIERVIVVACALTPAFFDLVHEAHMDLLP
jgi:hypothetical protein